MPNKKVTIQDIADELGISRNTVSKALNNTGILAENTKQKVINKAIEMGYKQFSYIENQKNYAKSQYTKEIALITCSMPTGSHSGSIIISEFEKNISKNRYKLSIYIIRENELKNQTFPPNFNPNYIAGIMCVEMFDLEYSKLISNLNIPTIFFDFSANFSAENIKADILLMENYESMYRLIKNMINKNIKKFCFVGDIYHCKSFFERWNGFCLALNEANIAIDNKNYILENDNMPYNNFIWLSNKILSLPIFPEIFVCANDFLAIEVIKTLKTLNFSIPKDVLVCGFDNILESKIIEPHLTTIDIPKDNIGELAAEMLLKRISKPEIPYNIVYVKTQIKYRESTNF